MERAPAALRPLIEKQLVAPVEMRWADGVAPDLLDPDPARVWPARQALWLKLRDPIGARERLDECCAAYMSDQFLLATTLLPHRIQFPSPKLAAIATLDHSMWFHGEFSADDWLLYDMTSPRASGGVGLAFGHLFRRDTGQLVVSMAQQGLIRPAKPSASGAAITGAMRAARVFDHVQSMLPGRA